MRSLARCPEERLMCRPHRYQALISDEDYPSNMNLSQWVWKDCNCQWCGPDQERRQYCASCRHDYADLQWKENVP
jgi:hypothetical protein